MLIHVQNNTFGNKECIRKLKYVFRSPRKDFPHGRKKYDKVVIEGITTYPIDIISVLVSKIANEIS